MNLVESIKTLPIKAEQSVRRNSIRAITSCKAGKIVPLSCIPLLREDRVSRGRARINLEMMETPETLMTPINVTAYAHFVPFLAFDRFEGSLDRFNRAYEGVPDKEGGDVVEFFRAHPYDGASEFYNTLGIHQPDGKNINAAYVEAYNAVVNFRRKSRSTKLPERTELDTTLSEAFWKNPGMSMIVPDFDQAAIDGEVQLNFSDAKIPVTGLGIATAGAMSTVTANRQMRQSDLSTVDVARYYNNTNQGWITIDTQQVGTQWFPAIYAEMQERNVQLSLSNIEMAKQTAAFARMRKEYSGLEDDHIIDLLMNAIRVPDAQMAQPILLDRKSTIVGYSKRYATDSANLDKSVTTGETFLDLSVRTSAAGSSCKAGCEKSLSSISLRGIRRSTVQNIRIRNSSNSKKTSGQEPDRLRDILCWRDERYVSNQLAFSYDRLRIILQENEITRGLPGKYVDTYEFADGRLEFRWKGVSLSYSVFDKDQRVTHAAITENKHLSAVLAHIKAEQDKTPPKKRRAGKQRTQYTPNGRRNTGWNSLADRKAKATRAASQGCDV